MIELRNVKKEYSKGNAALNGVSVKIERGEFVFIVGDSGSGKSTLIRLIMKELNPTDGTIIVNGQNLNRMRHRNIAKYRRGLGVVFQDFRLLKDRNICIAGDRDTEQSDQEKSTGCFVTGRTCTEVQVVPEGTFRRRAAESCDRKGDRK